MEGVSSAVLLPVFVLMMCCIGLVLFMGSIMHPDPLRLTFQEEHNWSLECEFW